MVPGGNGAGCAEVIWSSQLEKKKKVSVYKCFVVAFVILDFGVRGKWK